MPKTIFLLGGGCALDKRKRQVLQAVVRLYTLDGEPVGSSLLANHFSMAVSSATLRSDMAALTKLGLLEQPHTSAGRIPSTKGFRYYIDNLMESSTQISEAEKLHIFNAFKDMDFDPEGLARDTAKALAKHTGLAALASTPKSNDVCIAHFEVVQVGLYSAAILAVNTVGAVSTRTVKFTIPLGCEELDLLQKIINSNLTFLNPADVSDSFIFTIEQYLQGTQKLLVVGIKAALTLLKNCDKKAIHLEGKQHLPALKSDNTSFKNLMFFLSDEVATQKYLKKLLMQTTILLGDDIEEYPMPDYCIIGKQYVAGGGTTGTLAVVGPLRINFTDIALRIELFANILGQYMSGKHEKEILV